MYKDILINFQLTLSRLDLFKFRSPIILASEEGIKFMNSIPKERNIYGKPFHTPIK